MNLIIVEISVTRVVVGFRLFQAWDPYIRSLHRLVVAGTPPASALVILRFVVRLLTSHAPTAVLLFTPHDQHGTPGP